MKLKGFLLAGLCAASISMMPLHAQDSAYDYYFHKSKMAAAAGAALLASYLVYTFPAYMGVNFEGYNCELSSFESFPFFKGSFVKNGGVPLFFIPAIVAGLAVYDFFRPIDKPAKR